MDGVPYLGKQGGGFGFHGNIRIYRSLGLATVLLANRTEVSASPIDARSDAIHLGWVRERRRRRVRRAAEPVTRAQTLQFGRSARCPGRPRDQRGAVTTQRGSCASPRGGARVASTCPVTLRIRGPWPPARPIGHHRSSTDTRCRRHGLTARWRHRSVASRRGSVKSRRGQRRSPPLGASLVKIFTSHAGTAHLCARA